MSKTYKIHHLRITYQPLVQASEGLLLVRLDVAVQAVAVVLDAADSEENTRVYITALCAVVRRLGTALQLLIPFCVFE